jgi:hypothetical protein
MFSKKQVIYSVKKKAINNDQHNEIMSSLLSVDKYILFLSHNE